MSLPSNRRWLQFEMHRTADAVSLNIVANRRGLGWLRHGLRIAVVLAVLGVIYVQHQKESSLQAMYGRLEQRAIGLLKERDDLKWRADAWEKEAVEWRQKNGTSHESSQPDPQN